MLVKRGLVLSLALLLSLSGTACQKEALVDDYTVIEKSHSKRPSWVNKSGLESKKYYYFVGSAKSDSKNDLIVLNRGQGEYQRFLNAQAKRYLLPIKQRFGQATYLQFSGSFSKYLYLHTKDQVKRRRIVYWEKIETIGPDGPKQHFVYHAVLRLDKSLYYRSVRHYFKRHMRTAQLNEKNLLHAQLDAIRHQFEKDIESNNKSLKKVKDDLIRF